MVFRVDIKKRLRASSLQIDTRDGISVTDDSPAAAAMLMRKALQRNASVIVFGKNPDFYPALKDMAPINIGTYDGKGIKRSLKWPFITDLAEKTVIGMEKPFEEANMEHDLINLISRKTPDRTMIQNPFMHQGFFQLKDAGDRKERIITESLLTGLLLQCMNREPSREVVFFIDAPYHPFTRHALDAVNRSDRYDIPIVCMYPDSGDGFDKSGYALHDKNGLIKIRIRKTDRTYRINA